MQQLSVQVRGMQKNMAITTKEKFRKNRLFPVIKWMIGSGPTETSGMTCRLAVELTAPHQTESESVMLCSSRNSRNSAWSSSRINKCSPEVNIQTAGTFAMNQVMGGEVVVFRKHKSQPANLPVPKLFCPRYSEFSGELKCFQTSTLPALFARLAR